MYQTPMRSHARQRAWTQSSTYPSCAPTDKSPLMSTPWDATTSCAQQSHTESRGSSTQDPTSPYRAHPMRHWITTSVPMSLPNPAQIYTPYQRAWDKKSARIFAAAERRLCTVLLILHLLLSRRPVKTRPEPPVSRNLARCISGILTGLDHRPQNPAIAMRSLQHLCKPTPPEILKRKSQSAFWDGSRKMT